MAKTKNDKKKTRRGAEMSIADIMGAKKPRTIEYLVCLDSELADAKAEAAKVVDDLEKKIQAKQMLSERKASGTVAESVQERWAEEAIELQAELDDALVVLEEATEAAAEISVDFVFESIGRLRLEELQRAHKPKPDQIREFKEGLKKQGLPDTDLNYNPDTFPPALIAAASHQPKMTEEEAQEMWDSDRFSNGELSVMFQTAWQVNSLIAT